MRDCEAILIALLRGEPPSDEESAHVGRCARCAPLAPGLRAAALALAPAVAPVEPPPGLTERVLRAATPLLVEGAHAARRAAGAATFDGRRLAAALAPAVLAFPLLVLFDVLLLRAAHALLAELLPAPLTTYLVASYAALLAALACLTFGAIPLLVQRQAYAPWKEGHV
ncbi:MAG: hypothetical protein AB1689_15475 [Thermodesulfobacteriota bacterium]